MRRNHVPAVLLGVLNVGLLTTALATRIAQGTVTIAFIIELIPDLGIAAVSTLLVWKRPTNAVSWILAALGVVAGYLLAADALFRPLLDRPPTTAELAILLVDGKIFFARFGLIAALFHLFPNGRPASTFWRRVGYVALVSFVLVAAVFVFDPGLIDDEAPRGPSNPPNPIGLTGTASTVLRALDATSTPVFLLSGLFGGIASLVFRYRRGSTTERLQIRWFASAAAVFGSLLLVNVPLRGTGIVSIDLLDALLSVASLGLPVAIAVAILRYRLYDIGRIVSRTVSYAVVTAMLGALFALIVAIAPSVFLSTQETPDYLVAAATLIVAALFRPVRTRVQRAVDHRFNRARYNAEHTIEAFTTRLREQVDIDALGAELIAVVKSTMQPLQMSLWIRREST